MFDQIDFILYYKYRLATKWWLWHFKKNGNRQINSQNKNYNPKNLLLIRNWEKKLIILLCIHGCKNKRIWFPRPGAMDHRTLLPSHFWFVYTGHIQSWNYVEGFDCIRKRDELFERRWIHYAILLLVLPELHSSGPSRI